MDKERGGSEKEGGGEGGEGRRDGERPFFPCPPSPCISPPTILSDFPLAREVITTAFPSSNSAWQPKKKELNKAATRTAILQLTTRPLSPATVGC